MSESPMAPRRPGGRGSDVGRPRDPGMDRTILRATIDLLSEVGFARLSVADVARRAGVSKPAIYRRWSKKSQLVVEAMVTQMRPERNKVSGSAADGLLSLTEQLIDILTRTPLGRVLPGLVAEMAADPVLATSYRELIITPNQLDWRAAVERGIASASSPPTPTVTSDQNARWAPVFLPPDHGGADRSRLRAGSSRCGPRPLGSGPQTMTRIFAGWFVVVILIGHGLLHLLGAATGLSWAGVATLTEPIEPAIGATPSRLFWMDATMFGLPVDVRPVFVGRSATMRVKLCSVVRKVNAAGPEMERAETVTLFDDLCILAPSALVEAPIAWQQIDDTHTTAPQGEFAYREYNLDAITYNPVTSCGAR